MLTFMKNAKIGIRISLSLVLPLIGLVLFSGFTVIDKRQVAGETGGAAHQVLEATGVLTGQSDTLGKEVEGFLEGIKADTEAGSRAAPGDVIAVVPREFPPQYHVDDTGRPFGFAIDLMEEVAKSAEYRRMYLAWFAEPAPFWTARRTAPLLGGLLVLSLTLIAGWRYRSVVTLNRELRKALAERNRVEQELREKTGFVTLLQKIAVASIEAYDADEALGICLGQVCTHMGWPIGHVYMFDEDAGDLFSKSIWHLDHPDRCATFRKITEETRFAPGIGLPGRVLSSREPAWIVDVTKDTNFPRAKVAKDIGVKAGFAFPVFVGKKIAAVLEFFAEEAIEPAPQLFDVMAHVGTQLGRVIERKRAEGLLRRSEELKSTIIDTSLDGVITVDAEGRIVDFNRSAQAIFGYQRNQAIDKRMDELIVPPNLREKHRKAFRRHLETGGDTIFCKRTELSAMRADGEEFPIEFTVSHLKDHNLYTLFIRDLTEIKKFEAALRHSQKMEAVGSLTGGIAHDFNNLLATIIGNLDLLERQLVSQDVPLKRVRTILKTALRGADLTKRLLSFSGTQPEAPKIVNVNAVIEGMSDIIGRSLAKEVAIETFLADDLWPTRIDPGDLEDAILNLAINARDAMPEGGSLIIETANAPLGEDYSRSNPNVVPGDYVQIAISDTGIGMSKEIREHAFEPFFTSKPRGKGTGLGLSMVYGFVKRSAGHIKIYSEPGEGTTFKIYLPREQGAGEYAAAEPDTSAAMPYGRETVLVVDDEVEILEFANSYLSELGYSTIPVNGPEKALDILNSGKKIDLLFADVVMPGGMNGFELAKKALHDWPGIKVLLTSGFTAKREKTLNDDDQQIEKLAANFLNKPYRQPDLAKRVRQVLDAWE